MHKLLLCSALALAGMMTFSACDDDDAKVAKAPKLEKIELSPSTCNAGDTITATVTLAEEGDYYYYSYQDYKIGNSTYRLGSNSYNRSNPTKTNGSVSSLTGTATFKFKAPSKADTTYTVTFYAMCASSADAFTSGSLYAQTNTVSTKLTINK
jgi:hypothetical protein